MNKITLDELVMWIVKEEKRKYNSIIKPIDYYLCNQPGLLCIVNRNGDRVYFAYEHFLKKLNKELAYD